MKSTKANPRIYLLDDDKVYLKLVKAELEKNQWTNLHIFHNYEDFLRALGTKPDIVILDYHLDKNKTGLEMLLKVKELYPDVYAIFLTSEDHLKVAVETMKHGAYDYVVKNDSALVRIRHLLLKISKERKLKQNKIAIGYYKVLMLVLAAAVSFLLILYYSEHYAAP